MVAAAKNYKTLDLTLTPPLSPPFSLITSPRQVVIACALISTLTLGPAHLGLLLSEADQQVLVVLHRHPRLVWLFCRCSATPSAPLQLLRITGSMINSSLVLKARS